MSLFSKIPINKHLYDQALKHNAKLANSFFCHKIPTEKFSQFLKIYQQRPIKDNFLGIRSQGAFFLWYFIQIIRPTLIIESGVWKGMSTWMIEQAAPKAKVLALDVDLRNIEYYCKQALYMNEDFSDVNMDAYSNEKILCFFDDHQNAFERVLQSRDKGIKHLLFDDNYPSGFDDDKIPHLTLRNCFENPQYKKEAVLLKKIIKHYYITPQIIGKTAQNFYHADADIWTQKKLSNPTMNLPAIFEDISAHELSSPIKKIFSADTEYYRWITYVELH